MLNRSETLNDLRVPPGNQLEKLSGNREGQWGICINDQWRICFEWIDNDAYRVPARRINEIVLGKRRITADTALRLGRYFKMSAKFWLGLQMDYDLDLAEDELGERLDHEIVMVSA